jgi:hypothetical protein
MRIIVLLTLLAVMPVYRLMAQEQKTMKSYRSSISGIVYTLGDTLTIGTQLNNLAELKFEGYSAIYGINDNGDYHPVASDLNREKAIIDSIYPNDRFSNEAFSGKTLFQLRLLNGLEIYVVIDDAIKEKEIVVLANDDYLKGFRMLDSKMKADLSSINSKDTMYVILPVHFKEYNFEKNVFPVAYSEKGYTKKASGIVFLNFDDFSEIPIAKERAKFFNAANELTPMGTRSAYVAVMFVIDKIESAESTTIGFERNNEKAENNMVYHVKIKGVHCIDSPSLYYNYLGAVWK